MTDVSLPPKPDAATARGISARVDRALATDGTVTRFDRRIEFLSAVVLALATVSTAWCGYQSALWGGDEARFRAESIAAQVRAAEYENRALQKLSLHASLFVAWSEAVSHDDPARAAFLFDRFPPELATAAKAWLDARPLVSSDAPPTPFDMPEYVQPEVMQARDFREEADDKASAATEADVVSDRYLLFTVIFASVLFFAGVSGKFQSQIVDLAMLVLAVVVFLTGLVFLARFPVQ